MSAPPPPALTWSAAMPVSSVAIALTVSRAASLPVKPNAERPEHAAVRLQHHHVLRQLGAMLIAIGEAAAAAVLFVGEQHHAHGAPRPQVQLLHDPQRFPRHHAAAAIVGRAGADVPRVEMAADDDDFVRLLAAADFADDVRRFRVGVEMRLHLQPDDDACCRGRPCAAADRRLRW